MSVQKQLSSTGHDLLLRKRYGEAEKLYLQALKAKDDNPIDRHFIYNGLIKLYYALREKRDDALEKCIYYCQEDITRLPEFIPAYRALYPKDSVLPECPSLERFAIICEKHGEIEKAMETCELAINLGINNRHDRFNKIHGTKRGYRFRLEKLQKKLSKIKK